MPRRKAKILKVKPEDLKKVRVPLPQKPAKVHRHRKDRRSAETKQDLERLAEE